MTGALADPLIVTGWISAGGLVVRCALVELRWWFALRGTAPADRPDIIRALRSPRSPRARP